MIPGSVFINGKAVSSRVRRLDYPGHLRDGSLRDAPEVLAVPMRCIDPVFGVAPGGFTAWAIAGMRTPWNTARAAWR